MSARPFDETLTGGDAAGKPAAAGSLYDRARWSALLRRIARRTPAGDDPEDLLHGAFLRLEAYRKRQLVRNPDLFLLRAAVNIGIDNYRRRAMIDDREPLEVRCDALADGQPSPDEALVCRERLERVRCGLLRLRPRTRAVFLMHRLEGMKYREIAARLGISQSAVEKHIATATLFLAAWVEGW